MDVLARVQAERAGLLASADRRAITLIALVLPGKGGEMQLTDALNDLAQEQAVYAYVFENGRFDVGNKLDYLKATIELAVDREDVGQEIREYLADLVQRKKIL